MGLNGFLVVDKPSGWTSHDVVAKVRRACGRGVKVGHAGTLDPMATGVLVICLGTATRLAEWATAADKRYLAEVTLGVETDTYDADGTIVAERPVSATRGDVLDALAKVTGEIEQRPPPHSAIKVAGRRSYDLARRGQAVEIAPRAVTIRRLDLLELTLPRIKLDVGCSKGTYIRSLAQEIGRLLGCGAHLSALRRTESGRFGLEQAVSIEDVVARLGPEMLMPLDVAVTDLPRIEVDGINARRLRDGLPLLASAPSVVGDVARAHTADGALLAIIGRKDGEMWPRKVLTIAEPLRESPDPSLRSG